ncbi:right-handed parallel beta-helix repeat-containing protein [Paenibacillus allorhizosphaerae]|uniref:Pectate lyase superfamily protein domain-containing protein n=1 Tax=Paenibacillus allorhizosphaerae TaxID=2849866 RepID=A0ABN7TLB5_9BACL|nr:right-handed parallel beta-helix repeat-containing protein [Paenibacillus allorhizosphaerae]CAG7645244.1 hypothetical protein PAECIP111802_03466 [Paenibacillus allorhizosphaerae]
MQQKPQGVDHRISRRKLLASLGKIGAFGAVATAGAISMYSDSLASPSVTQSVYKEDPEEGPGGKGKPQVYNVAHFGAKGDGVQDDTEAFERALQAIKDNGCGTMYVPNGAYVITRTLRLYKNTTIWMEDRAVLKKLGNPDSNLKLFVNGQLGNANYAVGYKGEGNLTIIGGTIDLCADVNLPTDPSRGFMAFAIGHADGIHMERVTFINGHNGHIIEFNSSRNIKLLHCRFQDQRITTSGQFEMVQFDFASSESFPSFGAYDDTPCRDVLVEGCTFVNGHRGVGTHGSKFGADGKQVFHENIRIVNNHFEDLQDIAIKPESYDNAVISGNTIARVGGHGIAAYSCRSMIISNNVLQSTGFHGIVVTRKTAKGFDEPSTQVVVCHNVISDVKNSGLRIIGGDNIQLADNSVANAKREGIYVSTTNHLVAKNNVLRGLSQEGDGRYSAILLDGCAIADVSHNRISNEGYTPAYSYMVYVKQSSSGVVIDGNSGEAGRSGKIGNEATGTVITSASYERFLTGTLNATSGIIELNDDIRNYSSVIVATGAVTGGDLRHEIARGWSASGFRPGTDYINVSTSKGKFVAAIVEGRQIQIMSASDPLRYIIGIQG